MAKRRTDDRACTESAPWPLEHPWFPNVDQVDTLRTTIATHSNTVRLLGVCVQQTKWDHKGMMETKTALRAAGTCSYTAVGFYEFPVGRLQLQGIKPRTE